METKINSAKNFSSEKILKTTIVVSLFAAFICAGSFITIPLPAGVPITIQDMFALLAGLLLGPIYGGLSVILFLVLGSVGLPVFTGKAGLHIITQGATGGFLIGYFLGAVVSGFFVSLFFYFFKNKKSKIISIIFIALAAILGTIIIFVCGVFGFMHITGKNFSQSFAVTVLPFLSGNFIKLLFLVALTYKFRLTIKNYIK